MKPEDRAAVAARDLRNRNLLLLLQSLRARDAMSRAQLADETGLSVPSVHRLTGDLIALGWVEPAAADSTNGVTTTPRQGRPTTWFRFRDERAALAGVDVGSQTTRIAIGTLDGQFETVHEIATSELQEDLGKRLAGTIRRLATRGGASGAGGRPLVGVAVGVPSVVDAEGVLVRPWLKTEWAGLPLRAQLEARLGCAVTVAQDNHLSALAETSEAGTAPGVRSMLVVELGIGIGAGLALEGNLVAGAHGGLGRLMHWPCSPPRGGSELGSTLGQLITVDGLLRQYAWRNGPVSPEDGAALLEASRGGDRVAATVIRWAARELDDVLLRLSLAVDPDVIVLGGGLGRALHQAGLVPDLDIPHGPAVPVRASVLGAESVVAGALLGAKEHVPAWVATQIETSN